MGGFINGFMGGAGDAMAKIGAMELTKKADMERAEADAVSARSLEELRSQNDMKRAGREHGWKMDEAGFEAKTRGEDTDKKLASDERLTMAKIQGDKEVAGMRVSAKGGGAGKIFKSTDDEGNTVYKRYNPETDEMEVVGDAGGAAGGAGMTLPEAEQAADSWYQKNASVFKSDKSQFGGMSEAEIKAKKVREYMAGAPEAGGAAPAESKPAAEAKPGIINAQLQKGAGKPAATRDQAFAALKKLNPDRSDEEVWARINERMPEGKPAAATPKQDAKPKASPADSKAMSKNNDVYAVEQAAKEVTGRIDPGLINFNLKSVPGLRNPSPKANMLKEVSTETLETALRAGKNFLSDKVRAAVEAEITARQAAR